MKNLVKIAASSLLLLTLLSLTACSGLLHTIKYDRATGLYTDKSTGISYKDADGYYEAASIGEDYAKWKGSGSVKVIFNTIEGTDPKCYLTVDGLVLYAEDHPLPSLPNFGADEMLVCLEDKNAISLAVMSDPEALADLIANWEAGEEVSYPALTPEKQYTLKFRSSEYSWLYYNILYVEYSDGSAYLYCRDIGKCVVAGEGIVGFIAEEIG